MRSLELALTTLAFAAAIFFVIPLAVVGSAAFAAVYTLWVACSLLGDLVRPSKR